MYMASMRYIGYLDNYRDSTPALLYAEIARGITQNNNMKPKRLQCFPFHLCARTRTSHPTNQLLCLAFFIQPHHLIFPTSISPSPPPSPPSKPLLFISRRRTSRRLRTRTPLFRRRSRPRRSSASSKINRPQLPPPTAPHPQSSHEPRAAKLQSPP
jgi:hypothetical protein